MESFNPIKYLVPPAFPPAPPPAHHTASPNAPPTAPTALVHHICAVVEARGKYQEHHDSERELESQAPRPTQKTPGLQLLQDYYS